MDSSNQITVHVTLHNRLLLHAALICLLRTDNGVLLLHHRSRYPNRDDSKTNRYSTGNLKQSYL
jgi:hypothetical protein